MFIVCLIVVFIIGFAFHYLGLRLSQKVFNENSGIAIVAQFFLSILASYILSSVISFKVVPISEMSSFHFWLTILMAFLVNGLIFGVSNRVHLAQLLKSKSILSYIVIGWIIVNVVFVAELTIFNYRHFDSYSFQPHTVKNIQFGPGLELRDDNSFLIKEEGEKSLQIDPIKGYVQNLYIDIVGQPQKPTRVSVHLRDEGSKAYYGLPSREIYQEIPRSKYLRLHTYGETKGIKILIDAQPGAVFSLRSIGFNQHVPFVFSLQRTTVLQVIIMVLFVLRPKSPLYRITLNFNNDIQRGVILFLAVIQIAFFSFLVRQIPSWVMPPNGHHAQYHKLVEAFLDGQVHLEETPSNELMALDNPYDKSERTEKQVNYAWDTAYFNGKYYVYFGVGPVLFFYLPYYMLTGTHLLTYQGIFLVGALSVFAALALFGVIAKRWFPKTPFLVYLMMTFTFINSSGILYILRRPDFYSFSIILGILFSIVGLAAWIASVKEDRISKTLLVIGSSSMALVATCRPQMLIGLFFAIPIFWRFVCGKQSWFTRRNFTTATLFIIPLVIVASGLMAYNYVRFGSIIDFGANYNLTTNDMTKRGFVLDRIPLGLYAYFIQPTTITNQFPFIFYKGLFTNFQGVTIQENPIGGIVYNNILLVFAFLVFSCKKLFKNKREAYFIAVLGTFFSLIVAAVDTQLGGILMRYSADFSWLLLISATIVIFAISNFVKSTLQKKIWHTVVVTGVVTSGIFHYLLLLPEMFYELPVTVNSIGYLIQFWL